MPFLLLAKVAKAIEAGKSLIDTKPAAPRKKRRRKRTASRAKKLTG